MAFKSRHAVSGQTSQRLGFKIQDRFWGVSDIRRALWVLVFDANDPHRKSSGQFCCDAQRSCRSKIVVYPTLPDVVLYTGVTHEAAGIHQPTWQRSDLAACGTRAAEGLESGDAFSGVPTRVFCLIRRIY